MALALNITKETKLRKKRSHLPSSSVRTFLRDSVEKVPVFSPSDRSAAYTLSEPEFGTRSLPLRVAVESVPDVYVIIMKESTSKIM